MSLSVLCPARRVVVVTGFACALLSPAIASAHFASSVISYTPGVGASPSFQNPQSALGEPSRFTPGMFPGAVTPFNPAFLPNQLVQVGRGGALVVELTTPIVNDPANPFGIDLLVFGNAFLPDASFPSGVVGGPLGADGGDVDVSADGVTWFRVATNAADGLYPTLGYSDLASAYQETPGSVPTDFRRPVDPAFAITPGMTFAQLVSGYAGSGGGLGIDIGSTGLTSARFVRVSVEASATLIPEIDAFVVVPAPGIVALLAPAAFVAFRRARRSV